MHNVLINEKDRAALVAFHVHGSRRGAKVDQDRFHMVRLDEGGRILEGCGFAADRDALDLFFSA